MTDLSDLFFVLLIVAMVFALFGISSNLRKIIDVLEKIAAKR